MLEILAIIMLCRANSRNADMRGRSTAWAKAYTVIFWVLFEILAAILLTIFSEITGVYLGFGQYFLALCGAGIGALISWLIAKRGEPVKTVYGNLTVNETAYVESGRPLSTPCEIVVVREKKFAGMAVAIGVTLNGRQAGSVRNGEAISFPTYSAQNVVTATDAFGIRFNTSVPFEAPDGGRVEIVMNASKFKPHLTRVYPAAPPQYAPPQYAPPQYAPPPGPQWQPEQPSCPYCGAWGFAPAPNCPACGAPLRQEHDT